MEVGRFVTYLPVLYCAISPLGPLDYIHVYFGGITNPHTCTYSYSLHVHLFGLFNVLLHFFYFMKLFYYAFYTVQRKGTCNMGQTLYSTTKT